MNSRAQTFALELAFLVDKHLTQGTSPEDIVEVLDLLKTGFASQFTPQVMAEINAALVKNIG